MGQSSTARKAAPRDAASKVAQQRLSVLELARELGNVAEACRQRGMDRTSFYEWKRRFQTQGFDGLKDLPPIHKSHPQTTPPETVEKIRALALKHPAYGCNRHEAMLALEGIRVSSITIQKILHDLGLGTKIDRWLALEAQNAEKAIEITAEQAAFLEKMNPCFRERHVESNAPGELLSADTFFVGSLKGVGKVYLHAVVDTYGSYAFGFLHDPCRSQAQLHRRHRRAVRPVHPARRPGSHQVRQRPMWARHRETRSRGLLAPGFSGTACSVIQAASAVKEAVSTIANAGSDEAALTVLNTRSRTRRKTRTLSTGSLCVPTAVSERGPPAWHRPLVEGTVVDAALDDGMRRARHLRGDGCERLAPQINARTCP